MTNNNSQQGNDMSKFDTQIHTEDTSAYGNYVDADELIAIEAEAIAKYDDDYDDDDDYDVDTSYEDWSEMQSQYDDDRDVDFYGS
jgi:hypothetical protein